MHTEKDSCNESNPDYSIALKGFLWWSLISLIVGLVIFIIHSSHEVAITLGVFVFACNVVGTIRALHSEYRMAQRNRK